MTLPSFSRYVRGSALTCLLLLATATGGCSGREIPLEPWTNPFLEPGSTIRVQVDHAPGRAPSALALEGLSQIMQQVGTRPAFSIRETIEPTDGNYSSEDVLRLHRNLYSGSPTTWRDDGVAVLHVLYLDGHPAGAPAGGHAYLVWGAPLFTVYLDDLPTTSLYAAVATLPTQTNASFERTLLVHEYGHMLGLVGCDLPQVRPHVDAGSDCHSNAETSVMQADFHTSEDPLTWALDDQMQPVWRFDQDDWADIRAYQRSLPAQGQP